MNENDRKRIVNDKFNKMLDEMTEEEQEKALLWLDGARFTWNLLKQSKDETSATIA